MSGTGDAELKRELLYLFQLATSEGRLDVAEHLLKALETLSPERDDSVLLEAYSLLTRHTPADRDR